MRMPAIAPILDIPRVCIVFYSKGNEESASFPWVSTGHRFGGLYCGLYECADSFFPSTAFRHLTDFQCAIDAFRECAEEMHSDKTSGPLPPF